MTIKSPEFLQEYIRTLNEVVSFANCARRFGIDESTVFVWLRQSKAAADRKDDPSEWLIDIDGEKRYFHQHCRRAQQNCGESIIANMMVRARDGVWRVCRFQGKTVWRDDPKLVGLSDEMLYMLGYDDRLLRVNGELQPEMEWVPPSTDLSTFLAASHNPKRYGRKSSMDVNVSGRTSLGVTVMNQPRINAPLPMVEIINEAAEVASEPEPVTGAQSASDTDDEPATDDDEPDAPALPETKGPGLDPSPVYSTPTPPELSPALNPLIMPRAGRPLSDLERDLLSKLPSSLNRST